MAIAEHVIPKAATIHKFPPNLSRCLSLYLVTVPAAAAVDLLAEVVIIVLFLVRMPLLVAVVLVAGVLLVVEVVGLVAIAAAVALVPAAQHTTMRVAFPSPKQNPEAALSARNLKIFKLKA